MQRLHISADSKGLDRVYSCTDCCTIHHDAPCFQCGFLDGPWGIAYRKNLIFISSFGSDQILMFHATTARFHGAFGDSSTLNCPQGIAFGPDGLLYVANFMTHTIARFDPDTGAHLGVWAEHSALRRPEDLAFTPFGTLLVSSFHSNHVFHFETNGTFAGYVVKNVSSSITAVCGVLLGRCKFI